MNTASGSIGHSCPFEGNQILFKPVLKC